MCINGSHNGQIVEVRIFGLMKGLTIFVVALLSFNFQLVLAANGSEPVDKWFDIEDYTFWGIIVVVGTSIVGFTYQARENERARQERNLSVIASYSSQLTELKNKERELKTKKDCETYAQNYLDLMDQIAYLCNEKRGISKEISSYFENEFGYALTLLWWLQDRGLVADDTSKNLFKSYDTPKKIIFKEEYANDYLVKYSLKSSESEKDPFPWPDLIMWSLNITDKQNKITPFDEEQLPEDMIDYKELPEDDVEGTLEVVKDYSQKLNELEREESKLKSVLEWELYVTSYLDTLDSIAYLYRTNAISKTVADYFENYFAYGLTMIQWLEKMNLVDRIPIENSKDALSFQQWRENKDAKVDKSYSWRDLLNWCKKMDIEPYDDDQLPQKMIELRP